MTHTHECPDCKKIIPHDGEDCEAFLETFFAQFPCTKMRAKRAVAPLGTCMHCGLADLAAEAMEPLSDGTPSNMCHDCGDELRAAQADYLKDADARWLASVEAEASTALQRETWKRMSKSQRKAAMAGKASGELFTSST